MPRGRSATVRDVLKTIIAAVAAGSLMLTACSAQGNAQTPTSTSVSTSSSPAASASPTPTGPLTTGPGVRPGEKPPTPDPVALQHTEGGALEFAGYFIRGIDWSFATSDPYFIKQLSLPTCKTCQRYTNQFLAVAAKHGRVEGGRLFARGSAVAEAHGADVSAEFVVTMTLVQSANRVVIGGKVAQRDPAATNKVFVFVTWIDEEWKVVEAEAA